MAAVLTQRTGDGEGEISDAALCDAIRAGEAWPVAVLWERHYSIALKWARTKDSANAEDVVSEAFDAVYRALLGGGGPTEAFRSYLFRTINSGFSRTWTDAQRTIAIDEFDDFDVPDERVLSADASLSESEEQAAAVAALEDLPLRWKRVILEVDVGGRPVQEVAEELEMSPNSTSVLLKRAREGLKKSWLKRMHPNGGLAGDCAACVEQFSEIRWGKRNGRGRGRAEAHLEGCQGCRSRWSRFAEQATVVGMVSTSVIAMSRNWKRKAAVAVVAGVASAGLVAVAVGVALPALTTTPDALPGPTPITQGGEAGPGSTAVPGDARDPGGRDGGSRPEGDIAGRGAVDAPDGGSFVGDSSVGASQLPGEPVAPGVITGLEFVNSAHVNVNDLDLDGDGTPGAPTNEVWSRWGAAIAQKVDAANPGRGLTGATFRLWAGASTTGCIASAELTLVTDPTGDAYLFESGPGGAIDLPPLWIGDDEIDGGDFNSGLSQRCYVLEEVVAPRGYALPGTGARFTEVIARPAGEGDATAPVRIPNQRASALELSITGAGAPFLLAGGGALVVAAVGAVLLGRGLGRTTPRD